MSPTAARELEHVSACPACHAWRWDGRCRVCEKLPPVAGQQLEEPAA